MIGWLIIGCEIGFWIFVIAGLFARYILKKKKLGGYLLLCTPIVDLILIAATVVDLKNGAVADIFHSLAAIYIGVTVGFGKRMIQWADERFAYTFAGGPKPKKAPRGGKEHARNERNGWYRHLLSWMIGCSLLLAMTAFVGDLSRTQALLNFIPRWGFFLAIDFIWSFSYTLWPKKNK
ncbi:putative membrane protein YmcC [Siminovitchia terrae]|uniref:hypothetical protein n=1 Tax=Siminovitchia terrae TaxID=1914933 RepID=UPI001B0F45CC|nr:hypothetical protein [Siminovitchia terrae]GIN89024.1 putative membrane protein YmcC [Siminovitchia terrae]